MKLIRQVGTLLIFTLVFGFCETTLVTFFNDPKFWGEAAFCVIAGILILLAYIEFIVWYVRHQKYLQFFNDYMNKKGTNEKTA